MSMRLSSVIALLALTACADAVSVNRVHYDSSYTPSHIGLAVIDNPNLAIIRGNPFAEDRDNLIVLSHLQERNPGQKVRFALSQRPDAQYDYRLALVFGGLGLGAPNYCRPNEPMPGPAPEGRTEIVAVFCYGEKPMSFATGSTSKIARANDPKLHSLIGDVINAVLTDVDPNRGRGDNCRFLGRC